MNPLLLIDLSSALYPIFHMSGREPDPNFTSTQTLAKIHMLASHHQPSGVAICADSGRSFRKDLAPTYKANRPDKEEPLIHQLRITEEALIKQGYPLWKIHGYEADDVIATAVTKLLSPEVSPLIDFEVLIASTDKDLMQLVSDRVNVISLTTGTVYDPIAVSLKFHGVKPEQMIDYQIMVGDSADNIKGIRGIGSKRAAAILFQHGSLDALYEKMSNGAVFELGLTPALRTALVDAKPEIPTLRALVTLRRDLDLNVSSIFEPRTPAPEESTMDEPIIDDMDDAMPTVAKWPPELTTTVDAAFPRVPVEPPRMAQEPQPAPEPNGKPSSTALTVLPPAGTQWERELEPRNLEAARVISKFLHESRLFSAYGSPQAVFSIILAGRELGLGTMASLRGFSVVEGRPTLNADLIRSLVLASGKAEYFRITERTAERATWETKRKGDTAPVTLTYTIEEANIAGLVRPNSAWVKHKVDMLAKTGSTKLARLMYPDICFGLYSPAEMGADEV